MAGFVHSLAIQSWTLYSICIILTICRLVSRRMRLGAWRNLKLEDGWMCFAVTCYTVVIVSVNETAQNGSNYMSPEKAARLTPEAAVMAVYGSKMTLVLETFQLTCLWSAKGCLVVLYYRISEGFSTKQNVMIAVGVFCAVTYVLVVALLLTYWCRPVQEYWRVPVKYSQCATYYHHMIFATACGISSDLMILAFPVALVSTMRALELRKKIIVIGVLSLGVFSILTAVLNRYYNFTNPDDLNYVFWYVGESSTALMVANLPLCWPLLQRLLNSAPCSAQPDGSPGRTPPQSAPGRAGRPRTGRPGPAPRRPGSLGILQLSGSTTLASATTPVGDVVDKTALRRGDSLAQGEGRVPNAVAEAPDRDVELGLGPSAHTTRGRIESSVKYLGSNWTGD